MNAEESQYLAYYIPRNPRQGDRLKCPSCGQWSALADWSLEYIDCDTCGPNEMPTCPLCEEAISLCTGYGSSRPIEVSES